MCRLPMIGKARGPGASLYSFFGSLGRDWMCMNVHMDPSSSSRRMANVNGDILEIEFEREG